MFSIITTFTKGKDKGAMDASAFMRLREGLSGELIPTLSLGTEDGLSSGAWPTLTQAGNGKAWNAFQFQVPELWL